MKKHWLITAAMLVALSANAWGNSNPTPATPPLAPLPEATSPAIAAPSPVAASPAPADPAPMAPMTPMAPAPATPAASSTTPEAAPATATAPAATSSAPATESKTGKKHHEYTLDEARKKAHEKADALDKMTDDEWKAMQKKKHDHYVMWKHMTPEEKAEYKKAHPWHHKDSTSTTSTTTTPATTAPAVSGQ